jgi:hypothetical protein
LLYRISPVDTFSNLEPLVLRGTIDLLNFADGIDRLASHRQHSGQIAEFLTALQFPTPKTFHVKPSISFTPRADLDKSFRQQREIAVYLSGFWRGGGIEVPRGTGELACRNRISSEFESTALVSRETSCICLKALLNFRQSRFSWRESSRLQTKKVA